MGNNRSAVPLLFLGGKYCFPSQGRQRARQSGQEGSRNQTGSFPKILAAITYNREYQVSSVCPVLFLADEATSL